MADTDQGQPGGTSAATATETPPPAAPAPSEPAPAATASAIETPNTTETQTTTSTPAAEADGPVDWDKVDAGAYHTLVEAYLPMLDQQGKPAEAIPDSGKGIPDRPAAEAPEAAAAEPAPEPEPEPEPAEPIVEVSEETSPFGDKFRPRLGKLPKVKQETVQLVREMEEQGSPIDFAEAERRVKAKYGLEVEPPAAESAAPLISADEYAETIKELRAQKAKAAEGADLVLIEQLADQIEDAKEARATALAAEHAAQDRAAQALEAEKAAVRTKYPTFQNPNSPLSQEFDRVYAELEADGSPILSAPPEKQLRAIAKMAAANLGIKPASPLSAIRNPVSAGAPAPILPANPPPPALPPRVQPASGSARTVTPVNIEQQLSQRISAINTTEDYEALKEALLAATK